MSSLFTLFAACGDKPTFFGLEPWYQYLTQQKDAAGACGIANFQVLAGNGHASSVPLILLAVVDDLFRVAGLLAVGYVIYGGVQFINSQGSPDVASKARSTVMNALIGVGIAAIAIATIGYLGNRLGG